MVSFIVLHIFFHKLKVCDGICSAHKFDHILNKCGKFCIGFVIHTKGFLPPVPATQHFHAFTTELPLPPLDSSIPHLRLLLVKYLLVRHLDDSLI